MDILRDNWPKAMFDDGLLMHYLPIISQAKHTAVLRTCPFGEISRYYAYPYSDPAKADVLIPHEECDKQSLPQTKPERLLLYLKNGPISITQDALYMIKNEDLFEVYTADHLRKILPELKVHDEEKKTSDSLFENRLETVTQVFDYASSSWDTQSPAALQPHFQNISDILIFLAKHNLHYPWRVWYVNYKMINSLDKQLMKNNRKDVMLLDLYARYARAGGPPLASWKDAVSRMYYYMQKRAHTFEEKRYKLLLMPEQILYFAKRDADISVFPKMNRFWELRKELEATQPLEQFPPGGPDEEGMHTLGLRRPAHRSYGIAATDFVNHVLLAVLLTSGPLQLTYSESLHDIMTYDNMTNFTSKEFKLAMLTVEQVDAERGQSTLEERLEIVREMFFNEREVGCHTPAPLRVYFHDIDRMCKFLAENHLHLFQRMWYIDLQWFYELPGGYNRKTEGKHHDVVLMASYARYTRYGGERLTAPSRMFDGVTHPIKRITLFLKKLREGDSRFRMFGREGYLPIYDWESIEVEQTGGNI